MSGEGMSLLSGQEVSREASVSPERKDEILPYFHFEVFDPLVISKRRIVSMEVLLNPFSDWKRTFNQKW
jgi:hypothetical protein